MGKVLRCRDVGMECEYEVRGTTVEEVMEKAVEHARDVHGMIHIPIDVAAKIQAAIKEEESLEEGPRWPKG